MFHQPAWPGIVPGCAGRVQEFNQPFVLGFVSCIANRFKGDLFKWLGWSFAACTKGPVSNHARHRVLVDQDFVRRGVFDLDVRCLGRHDDDRGGGFQCR